MERAVGRAELYASSSAGSPSPSQEANGLPQAQDIPDFQFITTAEDVARDQTNATEEDELDFRLFAPTKTQDEAAIKIVPRKIRLKSPSLEATEAGFLAPYRPPGYYFTHTPDAKHLQMLKDAAISGEEIKRLSSSPWPGSAYPWKVLHLPGSTLRAGLQTKVPAAFEHLTHADDGRKKHGSPGKKYRIKLRSRERAAMERKAATEAAAKAKEDAEREKRTRRNREKKVKKKMREKAKKSEIPDAAASVASEDG